MAAASPLRRMRTSSPRASLSRQLGPRPKESLAGLVVVETHNHGSIGNTLMGDLEAGAISPRIWQATDILVAMHMSGTSRRPVHVGLRVGAGVARDNASPLGRDF